VGTDVYALTGRGLYRAPLTGGAPVSVYLGDDLPQHAGTLKANSLRAEGGRLFLDQACHLDADAPEYGTVELNLSIGRARWLNNDPAFPFVPQVHGRFGWDRLLSNSTGIYAWQN
jgi:hypothetical protein